MTSGSAPSGNPFPGWSQGGREFRLRRPLSPPPGDVRSPGHVGIEEIRGGAGGGGGDLLGLLLLFSLAANVASREELGASPATEVGTSSGPDELPVERPGPCAPAFRPWPPLPHPHHRCPASRCIKDLKRSRPTTLPS